MCANPDDVIRPRNFHFSGESLILFSHEFPLPPFSFCSSILVHPISLPNALMSRLENPSQGINDCCSDAFRFPPSHRMVRLSLICVHRKLKPRSHWPLTGWSVRLVNYTPVRVDMGVSDPIKFGGLEALQDNLY